MTIILITTIVFHTVINNNQIIVNTILKKPSVTSDKFLDSPSKLPCTPLWNKRKIWPYIKSHLGPYPAHHFKCTSHESEGNDHQRYNVLMVK